MNGAGNDFVVIDNRDGTVSLSPAQIAHLCDRHRGIGADGLLLAETDPATAALRMRYFNADGGEAEMCGNAARCFARFALALGATTAESRFLTMAGEISARCDGRRVTVGLTDPTAFAPPRELLVGGRPLRVSAINTGVPHAVVETGDLEATDVAGLGRQLRFHAAFAPRGTNANFIRVEAPGRIAIRTYERGVEAETLACGTGVTAAALVHHELSGAPPPIHVRVRGGETLEVSFRRTAAGFRGVTLTGPADFAFRGTIEG